MPSSLLFFKKKLTEFSEIINLLFRQEVISRRTVKDGIGVSGGIKKEEQK
jgi:hypothetical protein